MIKNLLIAGAIAFSIGTSLVNNSSSDNIDITTSDAGTDIIAMFGDKCVADGCSSKGFATSWVVPKSAYRTGSQGDTYSFFRFLQMVPYEGDIYLYYYYNGEDPFTNGSFSNSFDKSDDGSYKNVSSTYTLDTTPKDFGYLHKSVIRNAYTFSKGVDHRLYAASLFLSSTDFFGKTIILPLSCEKTEIDWEDTEKGVDPIYSNFRDNYVVIDKKLCVQDIVIEPSTNYESCPGQALENTWCFFKLGRSSKDLSLASLTKVDVSYDLLSYRCNFDSVRSLDHVYCGLYPTDSNKDYYLDPYSGNPCTYFEDSDVADQYSNYRHGYYGSYKNFKYTLDSTQSIKDMIESSGITTIEKEGGSFNPLHSWLFGHDDMIYSFNNIQKLDDASLTILKTNESNDKVGKHVFKFSELCEKFRSYDGVQYDYAIKVNNQTLERSITSSGWNSNLFVFGRWLESNWDECSCHQIDKVQLLSLTFNDSLWGGDISFVATDIPTDTTQVSVTKPYSYHVNGWVENLVDPSWWKTLGQKILIGLGCALGLVLIVLGVYEVVKTKITNKHIEKSISRSYKRGKK